MGIYDDETKNFVKQNLESLVENMPEHVEKIAVATTNLGNVFNQFIGEGNDKDKQQIIMRAKQDFERFLTTQPYTKRITKKHINGFFKTEQGKTIMKLEKEYNKKLKKIKKEPKKEEHLKGDLKKTKK